MGHIAIFRNDLQALDCLGVSNNVVKKYGTVFLDPVTFVNTGRLTMVIAEYRLPWQFVI
jgi:hypothetical protein